MSTRSRPRALLAIASLVLVAACGTSTGTSDSPATAYTNPTSGALPTASSVDALAASVAGDCAWRELSSASVGGASGDAYRFCDDQYLLITVTSGTDTQSAEDVRSALADEQGWICTWWGFVEMMYPALRPKGLIPETWNGSPAPEHPAAVVMGGNWMVLAPTEESGQRVAAATSAYLLTAPRNCPSRRSLTCSQQSLSDFARLTEALPWPLVGQSPSPDAFLVFEGVAQTDGTRTPDMCGSYRIVVDADQATVLAGLPDVLRQIGFGNSIETGGSNGGTAQTFVKGDDANGRTLNIAVYAEDGGQTSFSGYVDDP